MTSAGELVGFDQGRAALTFADPHSRTERSIAVEALTAHGITLEPRSDGDRLWIADIGVRAVLDDGQVARERRPGGVIAVGLDGGTLVRLDPPGRGGEPYLPTWVAVDAVSEGGTGDVWVADGYGQSLVHRFAGTGAYRSTLTGGTDGSLPFDQPHAVHIDRRGREPELLVADRQNSRVQVFDLDGRFKRTFGEDYLTSPSAFAALGDELLIVDLRAHLAVVDADARLVTRLGSEGTPWLEPGWPNVDDDGRIRPPERRPRVLRSPHAVTVSRDGHIFVAEWLVGGRLVEIVPQII
jgi:hypothetical protein